MNRDFKQLREVLDGDDPFMTGGHQSTRLRTRQRVVPEWTRNNKKVREILLRSFPKLLTDLKQRARAARWARIIHLYFRMQYTYRQVASELEMTPGHVHMAVAGIRRVAAGGRYDGRGQLGARPVGRPKKNSRTTN
jgi:hypothetical protein